MEELVFDLTQLESLYGDIAGLDAILGVGLPSTYDDLLGLNVGQALDLVGSVETALKDLGSSFYSDLLGDPFLASFIPEDVVPFLEQFAAEDFSSLDAGLAQLQQQAAGYSNDTLLSEILGEEIDAGSLPEEFVSSYETIAAAFLALQWEVIANTFASPTFNVDEETGAWSFLDGDGAVVESGSGLSELYAIVGEGVAGAIMEFVSGLSDQVAALVDGGATAADFDAAYAAAETAATTAAEAIQEAAEALLNSEGFDPAAIEAAAAAAADGISAAFVEQFPDLADDLAGLIFGTRNSDPTFILELDGDVEGTDRDDRFYLTDDNDDFAGGSGMDLAFGFDGDDVFNGGGDDDTFFGGGGTDMAVYQGVSGQYQIGIYNEETVRFTVTDKTADGDGDDTLISVERLSFADNLDFGGDGLVDTTLLAGVLQITAEELGRFVEMYISYFDRAPDALGIFYWGSRLADGMKIGEIAASFFVQPESQAVYPNPNDNAALVDAAYQNLFERDAEELGRNYWIDALETGDVTRGEFMLALIKGARAETGSADDLKVVEDKAKIGLYYAAINGLNDTENAAAAMGAYDRDNAEQSLADVQALIDGYRAAAEASDSTELVIELNGFIDDPFAIV